MLQNNSRSFLSNFNGTCSAENIHTRYILSISNANDDVASSSSSNEPAETVRFLTYSFALTKTSVNVLVGSSAQQSSVLAFGAMLSCCTQAVPRLTSSLLAYLTAHLSHMHDTCDSKKRWYRPDWLPSAGTAFQSFSSTTSTGREGLGQQIWKAYTSKSRRDGTFSAVHLCHTSSSADPCTLPSQYRL